MRIKGRRETRRGGQSGGGAEARVDGRRKKYGGGKPDGGAEVRGSRNLGKGRYKKFGRGTEGRG